MRRQLFALHGPSLPFRLRYSRRLSPQVYGGAVVSAIDASASEEPPKPLQTVRSRRKPRHGGRSHGRPPDHGGASKILASALEATSNGISVRLSLALPPPLLCPRLCPTFTHKAGLAVSSQHAGYHSPPSRRPRRCFLIGTTPPRRLPQDQENSPCLSTWPYFLLMFFALCLIYYPDRGVGKNRRPLGVRRP